MNSIQSERFHGRQIMKSDKMMKKRGFVLNTDKKGYASVILNRESACSGCGSEKSKSCKSNHSGGRFEVTVLNSIGAEKGDIVTITLSRSKVLKGAATMYLIPVIGLVAGAFLGAGVHKLIYLSENAASMFFGFIGLALSFYTVKRISDNYYGGEKMPRISNVVKSVKP